MFAPSRITYSSQPQTIKKPDEFSSLLDQHSTTTPTSNVWSNSRLIHRIQRVEDKASDTEDEEWQEKQYELERLKALVPKTKKKASLSNQYQKKPIQLNQKQPFKKSILTKPSNKRHTQLDTQKELQDIPTNEEQKRFLYFLQSWTSTRISSHSNFVDKDFCDSNESYFHHDPFPPHSSHNH